MREVMTLPDGTRWRDLNGNGRLDPYEDPRLPAETRVEDLLGRLSVEEKAGLMFQTVIETGPGGTVLEAAGMISKSATTDVIIGKMLSHFNVHGLGTARESARWANAVQRIAEATPHGIPVTISTDPRHAFTENSGLSFFATAFSQWPESLGLAAIDDLDTIRRFADIARREYRAVGIHSALHPQVDLPTEPRWGRQAQTFGVDARRVSEYLTAYIEGFQGPALGPSSVACTTKHFPGGGPQMDGEDAHFPYGREQVYPGDRFDEHLEPFRRAVELGTSAMMPYYGMPVGLVRGGEAIEEVGFGFNRQMITGVLRDELGFQGVVVTDWELLNDNPVGDQVLPARAWGVEHLDVRARMRKALEAGVDQFGGEECVDVLVGLISSGEVLETRIDESVRRLLLPKFQLGLFDDPFVDEDAADELVGRADFRNEGFRAQAAALTVLENHLDARTGRPMLPVDRGTRAAVYAEGITPAAIAEFGDVVADPAVADLAVVRLAAPYSPRDDLFLESFFHQGSLEFPPGLIYRMRKLAEQVPLIILVTLDRPAILTPFSEFATALIADFGASDAAVVAALTGRIPPRGTLPMEIPRSMDAVVRSREDVPNDTDRPIYQFRHGLRIAAAGDGTQMDTVGS